MKRIAVLGANGQLGLTIQSLQKQKGHNYIYYSRHDLDITDNERLREVLDSTDFDFCINCAAYTNVEAAEEKPKEAFLVNAEVVKRLAKICNDLKIRLIHISTDYVFDGNKNLPYTEVDPTNPINEYGKSKLQGETHIRQTHDEHFIIRTSWLYAPFGKNFVKSIISKLKEDKKLKITTEQVGTPTSCIELAKFIQFVVDQENFPFGTYNFSALGSTTWFSFARKIAEYYDKDKIDNIKSIDRFRTLARRPNYSVLDNSNIEKLYKKSKPWEESLNEVIKLLKEGT